MIYLQKVCSVESLPLGLRRQAKVRVTVSPPCFLMTEIMCSYNIHLVIMKNKNKYIDRVET